MRDKARQKNYSRLYYIKNRERILAQARDYRRLSLSRRYGITQEEYDKILAEQGGGCAICGVANNTTKKKYLDVDHCHETGRVRGILCNTCNRRLVALDDKEWLKKAEKYVSQTPPLGGKKE